MSARRRTSLVAALTVLLTSACSDDAPSVLRPRSDAAETVERLWWLTFWTATVVVVFVIVFIARAVLRGRRARQDGDEIDKRPVPWGEPFVVIAGLVVSGAILAATFAVSLRALDALAEPPEDPALSIEVIGHNWWWEVRYPDGVVTANEIHIPVDRSVEVLLSTADVIHSFWVPELYVKRDQVPGQDNRIWLHAEETGRYRGQCAEFCGLQHAKMAFFVDVHPQADFDAWLARESAPAREPSFGTAEDRGREAFLRLSCAGCHAVRGTTAVGTLGPDLTHMASRETIGAGTLRTTREDVTDFVLNAQRTKPGASMPPTEVSPEELSAIVDYLMSLE